MAIFRGDNVFLIRLFSISISAANIFWLLRKICKHFLKNEEEVPDPSTLAVLPGTEGDIGENYLLHMNQTQS